MNKKYSREELQKYAKEHFDLDKLALEWQDMNYKLLEEKLSNPMVPYEPTAGYK